ncbi:MAG: serine/threonine protein kinase [Deltaproteobacteria bacterium]|nr:serine/threonine protein kinase [Deltaproteobacteria bacterium]
MHVLLELGLELGPTISTKAIRSAQVPRVGHVHGPSPVTIGTMGEPHGFRDVELFGEGATSRVYRATSSTLGRKVALKRLHPRLVESPEALARLRRELEACSRIHHASVVRVYDVILWEGDPTVVMDFVEGEDLAERIRREGRLSAAEVERIGRALLAALNAAHAAGIVHRDVKPQNVRLGLAGEVYLLDFGSARLDAASELTATGSSVGTPDYMPPESFEGNVYDPRVDLYGWGATLFESATGRPPHEASSLAELALKRARDDVAPIESLAPELPSAIAHVIDRSLARRPEDRFATAALALWALDHAEIAIAYAIERTRRPPCLHCEAPIAPESRACAACGSDHPFGFAPGSASLTLRAVADPVRFADALELRFPELVEDRAHVFERLAALGSESQPIVSFIDANEARAFAAVLERAGGRIEVTHDEGTSGFRLYGLGLSAFLGVVATVGTWMGATVGLEHLGLLALPVVGTLLGERAMTLWRSRYGLLSTGRHVPMVPWIGPSLALGALLVGGSALATSSPVWGAMLGWSNLATASLFGSWIALSFSPSLLLGGFSRRRLSAGASPEPTMLVKASSALSVPESLRQKIRAPLALAMGAVVVSTVPVELAAIEGMIEASAAVTVGGQTVATEYGWVETAEADPNVIYDPIGPAPAPPAEAPAPEAAWNLNAADLAALLVVGLLMFGPSAWVLTRRRRIKRIGWRMAAEASTSKYIRAPITRRPRRTMLKLDRLALEPAGDAFAAAARVKLLEAARELPRHDQAEDVDRIRGALAQLERSEKHEEGSLVARCIKERDPDVALRMDLLALEGRLEAEAATAWARRLASDGLASDEHA